MFALDNEALTEFARAMRGTPVDKWLAMRGQIIGEIHAFIASPQAEWPQRLPDRLTRTTLALAAWRR